MSYDKKLKREVKNLRVDNSNQRIQLRELTTLFLKGDLLPKIALTECLCHGRPPLCARCIARSMLTEAGFTIQETAQPKSNLILPRS